jgi:hypothetical protein
MSNSSYPVTEGITALRKAGYIVTPYPEPNRPTNLIVRLGDRTVTTLAVTADRVCQASVDYLVSEQRHG